MPAYIIVNIDIHDPDGYEGYKQLAGPTVGLYNGKYLARGGQAGVIEGSFEPKRVVILEFPDISQAKAWWNSPEYDLPSW